MLTQTEADDLIAMKKTVATNSHTSSMSVESPFWNLDGADPREKFLLDISRGGVRLSKTKHQLRARECIVLVRLDIDAAPHTNPDKSKIDGTHIHIYRTGFDDKWAYPVPLDRFHDLSDPATVFSDFCNYCNIQDPPPFQLHLV